MAQRLLVSTSERMVAGSNPGCVGASDSVLRGRRSVLKDVSVYVRLDFAFAKILFVVQFATGDVPKERDLH